MKHTARANPRRYLLSGIPPTLWDHARAKAKREGVAMRSLILSLIEAWLAGKTSAAAAAEEE
jgi:hypothetical protein